MDGWRGMLLDDVEKVLPDWAPFPTGLVVLGKQMYYSKYHVFTCNIMYCMCLGTWEWVDRSTGMVGDGSLH
jgi:hypothetical protein